jgi:hypothetical protein
MLSLLMCNLEGLRRRSILKESCKKRELNLMDPKVEIRQSDRNR